MLHLQLFSLSRVRDASPCNRDAIGCLGESTNWATGDEMVPAFEGPVVDHSYSGNVDPFSVEGMDDV